MQVHSGSLESMLTHADFLSAQCSDECGCPEEEWVIGMLHVTIHLEPDGSGHIFLDGGDWGDDEKLVECNDLEDLRKQAANWVYSLPVETE